MFGARPIRARSLKSAIGCRSMTFACTAGSHTDYQQNQNVVRSHFSTPGQRGSMADPIPTFGLLIAVYRRE
jgi:hypothetical protein